ncbi:unnamed protein product [Owenia fusiformis]|uniref:Uncharacterized protein n=1 Tax=Owenia fusiformis TaxID=6347 RepID=A0A8J1XLY2_OWEFU|nr:unnamed protein product [Owenia fusiformis]
MEMNLRNLFQDFNPSKFLVYVCLFIFSFLFALKLDGTITWNYWVIFLPVWLWKMLVISGAIVGTCVWVKHPQYRLEHDGPKQFHAMIISTSLHLLLMMFEILLCDQLETRRHLYVFVFIPLIFMSVVSIGICVWSVKHDRSFEMELFCSVNILQFIFLALRLDKFIVWKWVIVLIPLWIVMCVALIAVLYAIILAMILLKSNDIVPEQRRGNVCSAVGYTCLAIPMLIFQILLANRLDGENDYSYIAINIPLQVSLITLMCMAFGSKSGNHWWFGIRKDFCQFILGVCPLLQEYGNVSYKIQRSSHNRQPDTQTIDRDKPSTSKSIKFINPDDPCKATHPMVSIEVPD